MTKKHNEVRPIVETSYLWILMRQDLASMNSGKAVAHGAHAANMFEKMAQNADSVGLNGYDYTAGYEDWLASANGHFGTTITLAVNEDQLHRHVNNANEAGHIAGIVFDPTYPIRDGEVTHLIPLNTCGFVFGPVSKVKPLLVELQLMA